MKKKGQAGPTKRPVVGKKKAGKKPAKQQSKPSNKTAKPSKGKADASNKVKKFTKEKNSQTSPVTNIQS